MSLFSIDGTHLTLQDLTQILEQKKKLELAPKAVHQIVQCREYLDDKLFRETQPIYGISTGFGSLYNKNISLSDTGKLQENLLVSHACGLGELVPDEIVRLMLVLKVHALSKGNSGVQLETVQRLVDLYNHDILPLVYQQGSLGASGDLAPLAHLSLPLMGLGEVRWSGQVLPSAQVFSKLGLQQVAFKSKEALALLNGTQFMCAYAVYNVLQAQRLADWADTIGALSLDAFDGRPEAFNSLLHDIRPHAGQMQVAKNIRNLLAGSQIITAPKQHVQDPYSFRCIPQVHGASRDAIAYVQHVVAIELNSVTDNPTLFPAEDLILSGGNFHGQPLALALDFLAIAVAELANISERRIYQLISGARILPPFLVANAGLNSGFMIPQYTAASIVSQNKQLCSPASIDSIVSSNGQEDHVSMGSNAATKCYRVVQNTWSVLAIELQNAAQAIEFRNPLKTSKVLQEVHLAYRKHVPFLDTDRLMYPEMNASIAFIKETVAPISG